ncbi:MAG: GEGP motif-containing diheme protein [Pseudomonadota bacterium]
MKKLFLTAALILVLTTQAGPASAAYHHEGEKDADKFLAAYPATAGTKLDHCALCHSGGQYEKKPGQWVKVGSCQWCHMTYGYDGAGDIAQTMNPYGAAFKQAGRNTAAVVAINDQDSDGDGYSNQAEILADRFPGDPADDPSKKEAPYRIYTMAQIKALGAHTQFLLMNSSRNNDAYHQYTGLPLDELLDDVGALPGSTGLSVFAPDGWSLYHPLDEVADPSLYHVNGVYPASSFYYDQEADMALNAADGWCDYGSPFAKGRNHLDPINNPDGLKLILSYLMDGQVLEPGQLNADNKLDGDGPFRVVAPQKTPGPPDQSSTAANQAVVWPYNNDGDHSNGYSTRSVTIIRVEPLAAGDTDVDTMEAGWNFVDQEKIMVYGGIDGTDSNGNSVLDSEEKLDDVSDFNGDGVPDYQDPKTTRLRQAEGAEKILLNVSAGAFAEVQALGANDPALPQAGKPAAPLPFGAFKFLVTGLTPGQSVTLTMVFPASVPTTALLYKVNAAGEWKSVSFGSNDGDATITVTLKDGDPDTDGDGTANGTIDDPITLATPFIPTGIGGSGSGNGDSGCFVSTLGR